MAGNRSAGGKGGQLEWSPPVHRALVGNGGAYSSVSSRLADEIAKGATEVCLLTVINVDDQQGGGAGVVVLRGLSACRLAKARTHKSGQVGPAALGLLLLGLGAHWTEGFVVGREVASVSAAAVAGIAGVVTYNTARIC
jgi:hypothetical protein